MCCGGWLKPNSIQSIYLVHSLSRLINGLYVSGRIELITILLVASLLFDARRIRWRPANLAGVAFNICFLTILFTPPFPQLSTFIEGAGVVSYSALSFIVVSSLLVDKPSAILFSTKGGRVCWEDRLFSTVDDLFAVVWAIAFLLNLHMLVLLSEPLVFIVPNALIALVTVVSILLPSKALAYLVLREVEAYVLAKGRRHIAYPKHRAK